MMCSSMPSTASSAKRRTDEAIEEALARTGWSQRQAAAVATRKRLVVASDLGPAELTARYLTGLPDGMMGEFQRIIHVRVPWR